MAVKEVLFYSQVAVVSGSVLISKKILTFSLCPHAVGDCNATCSGKGMFPVLLPMVVIMDYTNLIIAANNSDTSLDVIKIMFVCIENHTFLQV